MRRIALLCVLAATTEALRPPAKVVVLDAYTATAGVFGDRDAAWRPALRAGDELVVYDRTAPSDVVERLSGADVAVVNKVPPGASIKCHELHAIDATRARPRFRRECTRLTG